MAENNKPSLEDIAKVVRKVINREFGRGVPQERRKNDSTRNRGATRSPALLVTQEMVKDCHRLKKDLILPPKYIMTPLAKDMIEDLGVKIVEHTPLEESASEDLKTSLRSLAIWSDRHSHSLKNGLVESLGGELTLCDFSSDDDLGGFVRAIRNDPGTRGVAISEKGAELSILLNKYPGIRAIFAETVEPVIVARERVSANALILSSQQTSIHTAAQIVQGFVHTKFQNPQYRELIEEILNTEKHSGLK